MPIEAIRKVASILFGAGLTLGCSLLLGRLIMVRLKGVAETLTRRENLLFSLAIGAAALSNWVFLLCAAGFVYDAVLWGTALVILLAWWRWRPTLAHLPKFPSEPGDRFWFLLLGVIAAFYAYLYLPNTLAPETSADGYTYHLGLVGRYYRHHGFPAITTNIYAYLSQGAEMLYLFAYSFGRHSAAKMVHFGFFLAAVAGMLLFARRHGALAAGVTAAVLYGCSPVVGPAATSSYNDCALAFYQFLTFYGVVIWWKHRSAQWLTIVGVLAGFCFAIKYTGGLAIPVAVVVVAWGAWKQSQSLRRLLRAALMVAAVSALFVLPWTLKNAWIVGNPVAPFYNRVFANPNVTIQWEDAYVEWAKHYSHEPRPRTEELAEAPLELTVHGGKLGGMVGPVFLLAPLALLAWRRPAVKALLAAAVICALPWWANVGTRFLIPSLVFGSLAMGMALSALPGRWRYGVGCLVLVGHSLSGWPDLLLLWHSGQVWRLTEIPWAAALRIEPEHEYLQRRIPYFKAAQILAREAGPDDRVLSLEPLAEAYFSADLRVSYQGAPNEDLYRGILAAIEPDLWPARELRVQWNERVLTGFRVVQRNDHPSSHWILSEIQFYRNDDSVAANTGWNVRATPFPWTAARIFDDNPLTAWTSGQPLHSGMSVEVAFPEALTINRAELIYPWEQYYSEFDYYGRTADGEWALLEAWSDLRVGPISVPEMKAWAGESLRRAGIGFLVINTEGGGHNVVSPHIAKEPAAWGLDEIGQDGPVRIYRVQGT